ncbi:MAG: hypothetical protein M3Y21_07135 [Candidatus Eremiobacteraeota bacterium]|nr:hypothetical protein [Candidatus Eremiobacteraeota bacterium]
MEQQQIEATAKKAANSTVGSIDQAANTPQGKLAADVSNTLEHRLAKEPSNSTLRTALMLGAGSVVIGSLAMHLAGRKHEALFLAQWVPTILLVALWGQVVKIGDQR